MKTIKTSSNDLLLIKVPKLSFYFDWNYSKHKTDKEELKILIYWETKDDRVGGILTDIVDSRKFEILGKLSDLKDEDLEKFAEPANDQLIDIVDSHWKDYTKDHWEEDLPTIKESFKSLLKSNDIDWEEDETLVIKIL